MPETVEVKKTISVRLEIPEALFESYELQAKAQEKTVEELVIDRLQKCKTYNSKHPLYFNDFERHQLEKILSRNLKSSEEALDLLEKSQELRVGPVKTVIPGILLKRIDSRKFGHKLEKVIEREAIHGLESYAGIR
jgi:hypothetical protein